MPIITLTTDFGLQDPFVGVMKGVLLGICPEARLVDLAHDLPPGDVEQAAFALYLARPYFPAGTIHLAVIDPGVGSDRALLAVRTPDHILVGPDNGLFSYILEQTPDYEARRIENPDLFLPNVSRTFHGRDILAPAAAHLACGFDFTRIGPPAADLVKLPALAPRATEEKIIGRVVYVDRFGNLMTNIPNHLCQDRPLVLTAGPVTLNGLSRAYADAPPGGYVALPGSAGFIEIARNQQRAEQPGALTRGTEVVVKFGKE